MSWGEEGERDGFVGIDGDGGADVAFERVGVRLWRRLEGWILMVGEEVVVVGGGLTRKERDRMESVMVRKYILVMVWNGLQGS